MKLDPTGGRFNALDRVIKKGRANFIKVANALVEMRVSKAFKHKFGTFEEYCISRGYSKTHAYRMIEGAKVVAELQNVPKGDEIKTESQARALSKIAPEKRPSVVSAAAAIAEARRSPVTPKIIKEAAAEIENDEPPGLVEWGQPVEVEPEEADYFPSFQASLKDLIRNIPRAVDLRPYLSALQVEAAFLSNKVNANRNNSAYV